MATAIEFNHVGKQYRLGLVGTGTLSHDLNRWWQTSILHHEDPYLKIGDVNDRAAKATSDYIWALRDIDFKVEQGDVVGIIGKNGAGKSTLLKLLSRVTAPTVGTINARGRIASLLEVGTGFHGEMTGRENIYMNGAILGMSKQEIAAKLDEIIAFSGCEKYIDTPVKRYSSGMTVRLGFAVAAFLEPEILVVDEVLAVGDAEFQKKAIGKMQDVASGGRTVLFVSHNMASIRSLCKSGVLLENGSVKFRSNDINEVVNQYLAVNADNVDWDKSIADREDRFGKGEVHVNNVVFKNQNNDVVNEIFIGQFLRIEIYLSVIKDIDPNDLIVSCGFEDQYGNRTNEWVSDEIQHDFSNIKQDGKIVLEIPSLNMRPNNYYFHFKLMIGDTDERCISDRMHYVRQLGVLSYSYFSDGMCLRSGRGYEAIVPASFVNY